MIPNTTRARAAFRRPRLGGGHYFEYEPVVAWDDDGEPLIVRDRQLLPAWSRPSFMYVIDGAVQEDDEFPVVAQLTPAPGWHAVYKMEDGCEHSDPLIGWGVTEFGSVVPLVADSDGTVNSASEAANFTRIEHRP